jgi:hypothetical protein
MELFIPDPLDDYEIALVTAEVKEPVILDDQGIISYDDLVRILCTCMAISFKSMYRDNFVYQRERRLIKYDIGANKDKDEKKAVGLCKEYKKLVNDY